MDTEIEVLKKRTEINVGKGQTETAQEHEQSSCSLPPRFDPNAAWIKEQFPNGDVTFF